jgi:hypothetical protein
MDKKRQAMKDAQRKQDEERRKNLEAARARYGDNHWWESEDPRRRAAYQLLENTLMYDLDQFGRDVALLMAQQESDFVKGRKVNIDILHDDHDAQVTRAKQYLSQEEREHLYMVLEDGTHVPYERAPYGGQREPRPEPSERSERPPRPPRSPRK